MVCSCAQGRPASWSACWTFTKSSERTSLRTYWTIYTSPTTASGSRGLSKFSPTHLSMHAHLGDLENYTPSQESAPQSLRCISSLEEMIACIICRSWAKWMTELVRNAAVSLLSPLSCLSAIAESLKNHLCSYTKHLNHVCAEASRGVTLLQPNIQKRPFFCWWRLVRSLLILLVHILQLLTHFKCESASALLCNELCFTLGQSSAKWCAGLEKAQLKNVRLML